MSVKRRFNLEPVSHPSHQALGQPDQDSRPALRAPVDLVLDRQRTEVAGFRRGPGVAGLLDRIVVERRDLVGVHAVGREPGRDMHIAESLDVGEHLVGSGPGHRAGGLEGVADQNDAGLAIMGADIEIGGPDLDIAAHVERADDPVQPG